MTIATFPELDEAMLEAARRTISEKDSERPPCFSILTPDVIRRWAYAIGDDNPLWLDEEYARTTRWMVKAGIETTAPLHRLFSSAGSWLCRSCAATLPSSPPTTRSSV